MPAGAILYLRPVEITLFYAGFMIIARAKVHFYRGIQSVMPLQREYTEMENRPEAILRERTTDSMPRVYVVELDCGMP